MGRSKQKKDGVKYSKSPRSSRIPRSAIIVALFIAVFVVFIYIPKQHEAGRTASIENYPYMSPESSGVDGASSSQSSGSTVLETKIDSSNVNIVSFSSEKSGADIQLSRYDTGKDVIINATPYVVNRGGVLKFGYKGIKINPDTESIVFRVSSNYSLFPVDALTIGVIDSVEGSVVSHHSINFHDIADSGMVVGIKYADDSKSAEVSAVGNWSQLISDGRMTVDIDPAVLSGSTINIWSGSPAKRHEENCTSLLQDVPTKVKSCASPSNHICITVDADLNITRGGATNWTNFSVNGCNLIINGSSKTITSWGNFTVMNGSNITTNSSSFTSQITIKTNSNFSAVSSFISNMGSGDSDDIRGIDIHSPVLSFRNNTIKNNYVGVAVYGMAPDMGNGSVIYNNTFTNCYMGAVINYLGNSTFDSNIFSNFLATNPYNIGIQIYYSNNNTISNSYIYNIDNLPQQKLAYGIRIESSNNNTIVNTSISRVRGGGLTGSDTRGVIFDSSSNNTMKNVSITDIYGSEASEGGGSVYGVDFSGASSYNTIEGSTIFNVTSIDCPSGCTLWAIQSSSGTGNVILNNNISFINVKSGSSGSVYGIKGSSDGGFVVDGNLINDMITQSGADNYAIYYVSGGMLTIRNNTISGNKYGVYLYDSTNNVLVNNTFINSTTAAYLQSFGSGSKNNTFINTTIMSSNSAFYFYSQGSVSNNTVINTNIWNCTGTNGCIHLSKSENNTFIGGTVNLTSGRLLDIQQSNNTIFQDFYFINTTQIKGAINLTTSSRNTLFQNATFQGVTESVAGNSQLIRKWYLDVYVNDTYGTTVSGANVSVFNSTLVMLNSTLTNSTGWYYRQNITQYINNTASSAAATTTYANNHTIYANYSGYGNASISWAIGNGTSGSYATQDGWTWGDWAQNNTRLSLSLDNTPPSLYMFSPNASYYNTSANFLRFINASSHTVWYNYTSNNVTVFANGTLTLTEGDNNITLWANDSFNNQNHTVPFRIRRDTQPPNTTVDNASGLTVYQANIIAIQGVCSDQGIAGLHSAYTNSSYFRAVDDGVAADGIFNLTNTSSMADGAYTVYVFCNDSFENNLNFSKFTFDLTYRPFPFHTIQLSIEIPSLGGIVAMGSGTETSVASMSNSTSGKPEHFFISSSEYGILRGLVFIGTNASSLSFGKSGSVHTLTLSQDLDSAAGLLAFTVGSGTFIHNRMPDIESGRFFYYPVPTFGYGLGFIHPIKIMLSYSNINLAGDFTINSGYHQLVVEKTASSVKSNVTIRTA